MLSQCNSGLTQEHIMESHPAHLIIFHNAPLWAVGDPNEEVEIYFGEAMEPRFNWVTFPFGAEVGQVPCQECGGSGWWGFGPVETVNGPCVNCKGTGRAWVGLL